MSKRVAAIGIMMISALTACVFQQEESFRITEIEPTTFEISDQLNEKITLKMTIENGSACWFNFRDRIRKSDDQYLFTTVVNNENGVCPTLAVPYVRTYTITLPSPGSYTFAYSANGSTFSVIPYEFLSD